MSGTRGVGTPVLLAGGGTGGHVFPGLAVAAELRRRGGEVIWMGRREGLERSLAEAQGIAYRAVDAKPWLGRSLGERVAALLTLIRSALVARRAIRACGARVTLGTGGYASVPALIGSFLARRPTVLLEPNARAGTANRWLSHLARVACTNFAETANDLACRVERTGVPIRREFFAAGPLPADPPSLLVVGGSQGALQINRLMPPVLERLALEIEELSVEHQVGQRHLIAVQEDYAGRNLTGLRLKIVPFIDDMAAAMRRAQLVVSRAGALTVAEIAASRRPALLIPFAAAGGHQWANAELLRAAGAAEVIAPEEATTELVAEKLSLLLRDRQRRERMSAGAAGLAREDAASRIAELLLSLGRAA